MVHPLNTGHLGDTDNTELSWQAMPPVFAPDEQ
jgi:hypothetical protein